MSTLCLLKGRWGKVAKARRARYPTVVIDAVEILLRFAEFRSSSPSSSDSFPALRCFAALNFSFGSFCCQSRSVPFLADWLPVSVLPSAHPHSRSDIHPRNRFFCCRNPSCTAWPIPSSSLLHHHHPPFCSPLDLFFFFISLEPCST